MSNTFTRDAYGDPVFVDRYGDTLSLEEYSSHEILVACEGHGRACSVVVPAAELIKAIGEVADITKPAFGRVHVKVPGDTEAFARDIAFAMRGAADPTPEPEPLWAEVRERPARAVKVTEELVRALAGPKEHPELKGLSPRFCPEDGSPVGVTFYHPYTVDDVLVAIGRVVILRNGEVPTHMDEESFNEVYQEVGA